VHIWAQSEGLKGDPARAALALCGVDSVQGPNECPNLPSRKLGMGWAEVAATLADVRALFDVAPGDP
jgi:hypothetical protein